MRLRDELIGPGDLENSYNMVSFIWTIEGMIYRSIFDSLGLITRSVMLRLIVLWDLGMD